MTRAFCLAVAMTMGGPSGCGRAMRELRSASPELGDVRELNVPFAWATAEAPKALASAGYTLKNEEQGDERTRIFYAKLGASMQSWGHAARLIVQAIDEHRVQVRITTEKHVKMNITEQDAVIRLKVLKHFETAAAAQSGASDEDLF